MLAYLVLSHVNVAQIIRLVHRLAAAPDAAVFVRHDYRREPLPDDAFAGLPNVRVIASTHTMRWGTFDQVDVLTEAIDTALASGLPFNWMVLLSGQDYPCVDLAGLGTALEATGTDGFLDSVAAGEPRLREENVNRYFFRYVPLAPVLRPLVERLWRLNAMQPWVRFSATRSGTYVGVADRAPFTDRPCYRGSFWWALSRPCLERLSAVVRTEPAFVAAYRQRLHPDESFVQTVLLAEPQFRFTNDDLRYIRWGRPADGSPDTLRTPDLPQILAARKPFARKFDLRVDAEVFDRLDALAASDTAPQPEFTMNLARATAPRLSIGMPVYNGANYIADAIRSILAQTFTDFELIISDNASTDETPEIVASLAENDRRVRFVRNDRNMGASFNFNRTFAMARGVYFRQAAHDDTLAPTCVERCLEVLDADPSVSLAYTRSLCIDELDNVLAEYAGVMHFVTDDPVERFRAHLRRAFDRTPEANRGNNPACNPIFGIARTATLATTPMVANYIASDMILLGELALRGKIYEVPEVLFFIRAHPSTSWANNPGVLDVGAWFDPANRSRVISYMPHVRWFYEYLRAIERAPLRADQRAACAGILLQWAGAHRSEFARESLSVGARFAGLRAWAGASGRRIGPPPRPVGL